jgi:hypothetical protein
MLKKCLIALILLAISTPGFAHVMWGYGVTTSVQWEWDSKPGPTICVKMKVVMWADLYFCDPEVTCIMLQQQPTSGNFSGCICMKLCVNFSGLDVNAKYIPDLDITSAKDNKGYRIGIGLCRQEAWSGYEVQPSKTMHVDTIHLTGNNLEFCICLKVKEVDPQALPYDNLNPVRIGEIQTKLTPTLAPPGQPANGIIGSEDHHGEIP